MRIFFSFLTTVLLLASSCSPPPALSVDLEAEEAALHEAADSFHEAARSVDVERLVSYYASDALLLPPGRERLEGTVSARSFLAGFAAMPDATARFEVPRIVEISRGGDLGYSLGDAVFSFQAPDGETMTQRVREFHLWKKQDDGSWRITVDIWNRGSLPPTQGQ